MQTVVQESSVSCFGQNVLYYRVSKTKPTTFSTASSNHN